MKGFTPTAPLGGGMAKTGCPTACSRGCEVTGAPPAPKLTSSRSTSSCGTQKSGIRISAGILVSAASFESLEGRSLNQCLVKNFRWAAYKPCMYTILRFSYDHYITLVLMDRRTLQAKYYKIKISQMTTLKENYKTFTKYLQQYFQKNDVFLFCHLFLCSLDQVSFATEC